MKIYKCSHKTIKNSQYWDPWLRNISDIILSLIDFESGKALDVGCGTGRVSIFLAKRGFKVDAIDIEPKVIEIAKRLANEAKVEINFSVLDFTQKIDSFGEELYDLIICSEVLEHVENYRNIIRNMYGRLKKNGTLIMTVPHDPNQYSILDSYAEHLQRFTISQLKEDLREFQITDCFTIGFPFMRMVVWLRAFVLDNILKKEPSPVKFWTGDLLGRICSFLVYELTKIDNFFIRLNKGTNIICKVRKK